ncbi:MAG: hypothetical protein ACI9LM_003338 [Alteromonadaceae bacterium]|jgi:hypothetical protein
MAKVSKLLQQAIDNLIINDVYLHKSRSNCSDVFDPKAILGVDNLLVQQMHVVLKSEVISEHDDSYLLRVFIRLGTRWIAPEQEELQNENINALIEADFIAEYQMLEVLDKKCIDEFALKNASFHVWPYWREYLSSQCERMRLPRVMLPAVQFNK